MFNNILPDLQASLLCDDARQEINGKFILIGLFDGITVPQLPVTIPRMFIVNRWCAGDGIFKQQTRMFAPDGITEHFKGRDIIIKLGSDDQSATSVEVFLDLKFTQSGLYWVEILLDDKIKNTLPPHNSRQAAGAERHVVEGLKSSL